MLHTIPQVIWPDSIWLLFLALSVAVVAGVVRGFAGFGFSALVVATLAPLFAPAPLVFALLILEGIASLTMRQPPSSVDASWFRSVVIGHLVFAPAGALALVWMNPGHVRVVVSTLLLLASVGVRKASALRIRPTPAVKVGTGAAAGLMSGLAVLRATMVNSLLWMSAYTLAWGVFFSQVSDASNVLIAEQF
jgi:uncharacterized protein